MEDKRKKIIKEKCEKAIWLNPHLSIKKVVKPILDAFFHSSPKIWTELMNEYEMRDKNRIKTHCLFCNSPIWFDIINNEILKTKCKRCKAWGSINDDEFPDDLDLKQLNKENKLRRKMIDEQHELLMYYMFTDEELLLFLTKKQLEAIHKILNNETLSRAEISRLFLMRKKVDKLKKQFKQLKFIEYFEYPE